MQGEPGRGEVGAGDRTGSGAGTRGGAGTRSASGAFAVLLGAAAWGSAGTAAHYAPAAASSDSIAAARIVLGGAVLLAMTAGRRRRAEVRVMLAAGWPARIGVGLAAVAVAGYQLCFFSAIRLTGVAIGTVLAIGSAPVFTGVVSYLTRGPRPTARWLVATAAAIAGCAVLVTGGRAAGVQPGGVGLALAAGFCYAVYAVTASRLISAGRSATAVMGLLFGGGAVLLVPVLAASSPGWLVSVRGITVIAYLGLITTVLAYLLYGRGLRTVPVPVAVTLGLAEPVVAALLGVLVLGERLTGPTLAGLVLVGLAIVILTVGRQPADAGVSTGPPG